MRRWRRGLERWLRALIACTVLLFVAPSGAFAVEPARDVSAWLALRQVAGVARQSPGQRASAARARWAPPPEPAPQQPLFPERPAPAAALEPGDGRYLYLDLQTLRC